ncbi:MAG TPA: hypothetical protein VEF04_10990, partial [Blastocatellia bacterium]|nr:hypothetical protein [Blastocatellia bacterium]
MLTKPLPQQFISRLWLIFFALSPLAYVGGITLFSRYDPNTRAGLHFDRAGAIAIAQNFARSRGIETSGWASFCRVERHNERHFYYRIRKDRDIQDALRFAPEFTTSVLLTATDRKESFEVEMAPDGRVIGFTHRNDATEAKDPGEDAARQIAQEAFLKRQTAGLAPSIFTPPTVRDGRNDNQGKVRHFVYAWPIQSLPEIKRELIITVRGNRIESERVETRIDDAFAKAQLGTNKTSTIVFGICYGLIVTV